MYQSVSVHRARRSRQASIFTLVGLVSFIVLIFITLTSGTDRFDLFWPLTFVVSTSTFALGYWFMPTEQRANILLAVALLSFILLVWMLMSGALTSNGAAYVTGGCIVLLLVTRFARNPS